MGLVDEQQEVIRKIVHQGIGPGPRFETGQVTVTGKVTLTVSYY